MTAAADMDVDRDYHHPRKRQHVEQDHYMDIDPPVRRPLQPSPSPFASVVRGPSRPAHSAPSAAFTFSPSTPYQAFSSSKQSKAPLSSPAKAASTALVLAGPTDDGKDDDLVARLGAASVEADAAQSTRRRQTRKMSPVRRARVPSPEPSVSLGRPASFDTAPSGSLSAPPTHHYSLHQHHYGVPPDRGNDLSHWWREEVPYVLLGYLQVLFNAALVGLALWLLFSFVSTIRHDVNEKIDGYSTEIRQEILHCSAAYTANNCAPETRAPALAAACTGWEHCMNRDPRVVGRARVGAETFAEVLDSFVTAISWKTILFILLATGLLVTLTNSAIMSVRHRLHQPVSPYPHPPSPYLPTRPDLPHWPASAPARLDESPQAVPPSEKKSWLGIW